MKTTERMMNDIPKPSTALEDVESPTGGGAGRVTVVAGGKVPSEIPASPALRIAVSVFCQRT
jgi:hypothetical protein